MSIAQSCGAPVGPGFPGTSSADNLSDHPTWAAVCGGASPNRRSVPLFERQIIDQWPDGRLS